MKQKYISGWGGFCDGRLMLYMRRWEVFQTRKDARLSYEDVRRVEIRELPKQRMKK